MAHKKSSVVASGEIGQATERPFLQQIGPLIFLVLIFLLNFISRGIFSPLLPTIEKEEVATAFREILLNAIEHGGRFDPSQNVEIAYLRARRMVICRVKDPGPGFSQAAIPHTAMADAPDAPEADSVDDLVRQLEAQGKAL